MSDVRPFLATIATVDEPRPLGSALQRIATQPATSPWSPAGATAQGASPAPAIDTAAIEATARERGREQGLAETAELRARLALAVDALGKAQVAAREATAARIAEAVAAVIGAWTQAAAPVLLYAPIVRSWLDRCTTPATAHVHPSHVAAVEELVGEAPLAIAGDAALRPGDIRLAAGTLELAFSWDRELEVLRQLVAAALEDKS